MNNQQNGQSLVEILIAVGVFALATSAFAFLIIDSYVSNRLGREISQATFIAEEGLEALRSIRDNDFNDLTVNETGEHGLTIANNHWTIDENTPNDFSSQLNNGVRKIIIESESAEVKKITSKVEWEFTENNLYDVTLITYLTNWQKLGQAPQIISVYLWPDSQGDYCDVGNEANCLSCPNHYSCVDEEDIDTEFITVWNERNEVGDVYNIQTYTGSDDINYVEVHYRVLGGIFQFQYYGYVTPSIRLDGSTYYGARINISDFGEGLTSQPPLNLSYRWETKPDGSPWKISDIENLQIGADLELENRRNYYLNLYQIYLEVNYTGY